MIYSLHGKLILKELGLAVVECGGVGYGCKTSYSTVSALGGVGSEVMLYTHLSVREDAAELYGFATPQELSCFKMLISVSGIGPKAALSILSDNTPEQFAFTVASGDSKAFTRTKGIGAKTAQRIILELKDKITADPISGGSYGDTGNSADIPRSGGSSSVSEALEALMVLGYSQGEAASVLRKLDPELSTQELIKETLKYMAAKQAR